MAVVLEVGGRDASQSSFALQRGFTTHVWEPSPSSNRRIARSLSPWITNGTAQVHAEAASSQSGLSVPFKAAKRFMSAAGDSIVTGGGAASDKAEVVSVPTVALDQALSRIGIDRAFFVKIDVQGHEARVLQGLSNSLSRHAFDYVMFEWWPSAMDQPEHRLPGVECTAAEALRQVARAGYALFELQVKARHYAKTEEPLHGERFARPLGFDALCAWYKARGRDHPQPTTMGYWTDFLAVAPAAQLEGHFSSLLRSSVGNGSRERHPEGLPRSSLMNRAKFRPGLSMEDGY